MLQIQKIISQNKRDKNEQDKLIGIILYIYYPKKAIFVPILLESTLFPACFWKAKHLK